MSLTILSFIILTCLVHLLEASEVYDYNLPMRKVTSCPSFASFKFACAQNHLISVEGLQFSPVTSLANSSGECVSDWSAECQDQEHSFDYLKKECSGRESCTLISYQLRSRTKCTYHQVISIHYKCVPNFEVLQVPIKCDICKNITLNNIMDNYGFIHSAWYPKIYPRVTCHSLIKNRLDHFIIIYSVSGSIGLDRIQIESWNEHGSLAVSEILTGNLTTKLVLSSAYDVMITVLTEDTYYFEQRRFLLYFYIIPKCNFILCSNMTGYPPPDNTIKTISYTKTTTANQKKTSPASQTIASVANNAIITLKTPLLSIADDFSTFVAPPLQTDNRNSQSKLSEAWLAAILALCYALIMVFAVIIAIYCRRRRRNRVSSLNKQQVIISPESLSTSHIIQPVSRSASYLSYRNNELSQFQMNSQQQNEFIENKNLYSCVLNSKDMSSKLVTAMPLSSSCYHQQTICGRSHFDHCHCSTIPVVRQSNFLEFDNYSQVITDEDTYSYSCGFGESNFINYGEMDVQNDLNCSAFLSKPALSLASKELVQNDVAYSLKTSTNLGSIVATTSLNSDSTMKNVYRAVEYTKSPRLERVRVKTCEESDDSYEGLANSDEMIVMSKNQTNTSEIKESTSYRREYEQANETSFCETSENEKKFVVKLFPLDEQEKEIQEMSMFVANDNTNENLDYSKNLFF